MTESSPQPSRWMPAIIVTALFLFLVYLLRGVLLPFVIAGALAYISMPTVHWLQRRLSMPRWAAAMGPFFVLLAVLAGFGFVVGIYLLPQIGSILRDESSVLERFLTTLLRGHRIDINGRQLGPHDVAQMILGGAGAKFNSEQAITGVGFAIELAMGTILTVVLFLYFLIDGPRIASGMMWVVPPSMRPRAAVIARRAGPVIFSYFRGIILIMVYATILTFVVTKFVLHVQHPLILALAVGVLELVPFLGPVLSVILIAFVAIEQITFWGIMGVALFATLLRVSIDQWVGPVVLGRAMKLPAPLIIFSFMAGGAIWGVLGVVVAIPAAAMIKIVLEEVYGEAKSM